MLYVVECELRDFEAWSGGAYTLEHLSPQECEDLEELIEIELGTYPEKYAINDFLWFRRDSIACFLGYDDWENLLETKLLE